jgi:hypothetical protein
MCPLLVAILGPNVIDACWFKPGQYEIPLRIAARKVDFGAVRARMKIMGKVAYRACQCAR